MWTIFTSLVRLGGVQIVIALTAIVRNKVLALSLGVGGFGEFSQLVAIATTACVIVTFGLDLSLSRNIAAASSLEERQRFLAQANGINLLLTAIGLVALPTIVAAPWMLGVVGITATSAAVAAALILYLFVPLEAAARHRIAFLTALLDIKGMTAGRSLALVAGTAASLPIVWYFGLVGAAIQQAAISGLIVGFLNRRCRALGYDPWRVAFERRAVRVLASLGVASLAAGFAYQFSDLLIRSTLIRTFDAVQNGIYQSGLSIVNQIRAIVVSSAASYSIATLSRDTAPTIVIDKSNQLLSVVLPIAMVAFSVVGLFSGPAFLILYSDHFLPAQKMMPFLLSAEYLQVASWVLSAPVLAANRIALFMLLDVAFIVARTLVSLWLLKDFGIVGVAAGQAVGAVVYLVLAASCFRAMGYFVARRNVLVFLTGAGLIALTSYAGSRVVFDLSIYVAGSALIGLFGVLIVHWFVGLPRLWARVLGMIRRQDGAG